MKTPFRYQVTESDCVPTTIINALLYLFDREEFPQDVLQKISNYSLNSVNSKGEIGKDGTYTDAIITILNFINSYKKKKFACKYEALNEKQIHLRQGNKIIKCINGGGVAILVVCMDNTDYNTHVILAIGQDYKKSSLLFFDPYYREKKKFYGESLDTIEWLGNDYIDKITERPTGQNPNLRVSYQRLNSYKCEKYSMGPKHIRECYLLWRIPPKQKPIQERWKLENETGFNYKKRSKKQ